MKILIMGAAGFIGTNLTVRLAENQSNSIVLFDKPGTLYRIDSRNCRMDNISFVSGEFNIGYDFEGLLRSSGAEMVYHLISTSVPTNSNVDISRGINDNVVVTAKMLDACAVSGVKQVVFLSSGGTVYGLSKEIPLKEDCEAYPISSYGIEKITIEKLLYLYNYLYGINYKVIRLSNPYGPYQNPNGIQGAVTTFVYRAINGQEIHIYGDGSVVRDYIYIDDAVTDIITAAEKDTDVNTYNIGSGRGMSINDVLEHVSTVTGIRPRVKYLPARKVDVPVNILDISRYNMYFGNASVTAFDEGIRRTADFFKRQK
jgi:UDP-glucose 4-epimerase